jgi:hypothetical protein
MPSAKVVEWSHGAVFTPSSGTNGVVARQRAAGGGEIDPIAPLDEPPGGSRGVEGDRYGARGGSGRERSATEARPACQRRRQS